MTEATILIVEDNGILAVYLEKILERQGYSTAGPFAAGEDALAFLADHRVDLILMDIELAGAMNGITTAETIGRTSDVPVIFLTGFSHNPLLQQAKIAGPYGYLIKPVPERELVATVEMALHRHSLDRQLQESEEKLRDILDNAVSHIWAFDGNCYTYINKAYYDFTGLPPGKTVTFESWSHRVHPEDLKAATEVWTKSWEAQTAHDNYFRLRNKAGKYHDFWCHAVPVFDKNGQFTHFQGFNIDISERKQAERNYQALFEKMLDGFALHEIIVDDAGDPIDYRFLAVNPAFERMTGLKGADLVGGTVLEVMPDTERCWIETYGRVALTGQPTHFDDYSAALDKYFEVTAYRPAPGQFACIFIDITEKKAAEEEKKKLQAQLQQAQKMEAIGTLAGGIAHDFNNILGAVLGYAEMARDDCATGSLVAQDLDQVIKAGLRAKDLVKQILAFSRQAESEAIPLQPAVIIRETLKMLRSSLPSTISIEQNLAGDTGLILADPTQIHQIIMNLCTNAFHAMEESGGTLSLTLERHTLDRSDLAGHPQARAGDFIHLAIGDTGKGINPEIRNKIFDPFFTTKEVGKGTGMGLSIVDGIVKSYGGFVSCDSRVGEGSVFHISLPALTDAAALPEEQVVEIIPVGSEHILFIDDEEMLSEMGQNMLQRLGYRVTVRRSSLEALTAFQNQPEAYDLVITDQTMPGMTGIDLARRMLQIRPEMPIILCTGYSSQISEDKAKSAGIRGFALKPLAKKDLAVLIRKVLGKATE
jgi:PAS domain S-box-containing protein